MKADKVTVTIVVEALSIDCMPGLVDKAVDQIREEFENGMLVASDGDQVTWSTKRESVEF